MRGYVVAALLVGILSLYAVKFRYKNNVCKTFDDYYTNRDQNENCYYNPDWDLSVPEIIERHGYAVEEHVVKTKDGYHVTLFRIPRAEGRPVFLQHGLGSSSVGFVSTGNKSLAFILAEHGYDVWLGNFRGSSYSLKHERLSADDAAFWDFSFDEHGAYDLPAAINHVYELTRRKIAYIGYSMGTTSMYVYGTTQPEAVAEKIQTFINFAPSVYLKGGASLAALLAPRWTTIEPVLRFLTGGRFYAKLFIPKGLIRYACFPYPFQMKICQLWDMLTFGFDYEQNDPETLPIIFSNIGDMVPLRSFGHFMQIANSEHFQRYDHGNATNLAIYGSTEPPRYDLSKLKVKVHLLYAPNDISTTRENVKRLYEELPSKVRPKEVFIVKHEKFNHLDFVMAKDVVPLLYNHVLEILRTA